MNYDNFIKNLTDKNKSLLDNFYSDFDRHCDLEKNDKEKLKEDFIKAILYYNSIDIPLEKILSLLDIKNLGGFYSRPSIVWYPLDDAAKIYPIAINYNYMAVFRVSMYLKSNVIPEILQMALNFTIKRFPTFAVTVKKGFFWHHLDLTKRRYCIIKEHDIPCQSLKISISGSQTFRVIYYQNRVSVEFFHILTDGTGGIKFLKTLVSEYFRLLGINNKEPYEININDLPREEEMSNDFDKVELKQSQSNNFIDKFANQIGGKLSKNKPCQIIHFKMNSDLLKEKARSNKVTITTYILSKIFLSLRYSTEDVNGEFNIQVPVNMRKFYPSKTIRNFSMYCGIRIPISDIDNSKNILNNISKQLEEKTSFESMSNMLINTKKMINALKFIPLKVKNIFAKFSYGFLGDKIFTTTLSNIGVIDIPKGLEKYIESMDFILGQSLSNRVSCGMITCNNITTFSITKMTKDPSFEESLFNLLKEDGIDVLVEGSPLYED